MALHKDNVTVMCDPEDYKKVITAYHQTITSLNMSSQKYEDEIIHIKKQTDSLIDPPIGTIRKLAQQFHDSKDQYEMIRCVRLAFEAVDRLFDDYHGLAVKLYGNRLQWYQRHIDVVPEEKKDISSGWKKSFPCE